MSVVVRVENVSKKYHLGKIGTQTMRGDLQRWWARRRGKDDPFAKLDQSHQPAGADFWALRGVSFDIHQGEAVGIIGKNGAGKSTLLKILSRITLPTSGRARIKGRIASLLEVGTGFSAELTGRENIFLNGAILGMSKAEVKRKFDEIVNFSGVEHFIDTPVKRYSSGMYVRLAFAVAAHLESEILILDEVLAVGDAEFQKKCLGKMDDVAHKEGRTVIFVSHDMGAVLRLCQRAVLLKGGLVEQIGPAPKVANSYFTKDSGTTALKKWDELPEAPGNEITRLTAVKVHSAAGQVDESFDLANPVCITVEYQVLKPGHVLVPAFNFYNETGINIFDAHDTSAEWRGKPREAGAYKSTVVIPGNFLSEGLILVGVAIVTHDPFRIHMHEKDVVSFNMVDKMHYNSARGDYVGSFPGVIRPLLKWESAWIGSNILA